MPVAILEILRLLVDLDTALFQVIFKIRGHSQVCISGSQGNILRLWDLIPLGNVHLGHRVGNHILGGHVVHAQSGKFCHTAVIGLGRCGMLGAVLCPRNPEFSAADNAVLGSFVDSDAAGGQGFGHIHIAAGSQLVHSRIHLIAGRCADFLDIVGAGGQRDGACTVRADEKLCDHFLAVLCPEYAVQCLRSVDRADAGNPHAVVAVKHLCDREIHIALRHTECIHIQRRSLFAGGFIVDDNAVLSIRFNAPVGAAVSCAVPDRLCRDERIRHTDGMQIGHNFIAIIELTHIDPGMVNIIRNFGNNDRTGGDGAAVCTLPIRALGGLDAFLFKVDL